MNTFCYYHRGHGVFTKGNEDDNLLFNRHKRNILKRLISSNASEAAVNEGCGQLCYERFGLPIMPPWDPGHGVVESHAEVWDGFWNLDICDGCGGLGNGPHGPGEGILNDKGGDDHDMTGHYGPKGYYDTTGYDAHDMMDKLPSLEFQHGGEPEIDPYIIEEHCMEATNDGKGRCMDRHTRQYEYCAERPTPDRKHRTEFCYYNGGNSKRKIPHVYDVQGTPYTGFAQNEDAIIVNGLEWWFPRSHSDWITGSKEAVRSLCEPICRDYKGWNLPLMKPWDPSGHGVVESRHQQVQNHFDFPRHPIGEDPQSTWPKHYYWPGGGEWPLDCLIGRTRYGPDMIWDEKPRWVETPEEMWVGWPHGGEHYACTLSGCSPRLDWVNEGFPRPPWNNRSWKPVNIGVGAWLPPQSDPDDGFRDYNPPT
ncbi:MAG: hypothetical protein Q9166_003284 [cf. Caloplaca sp. 2 TL-2023]